MAGSPGYSIYELVFQETRLQARDGSSLATLCDKVTRMTDTSKALAAPFAATAPV
jgi:hypothetical protein